jgi:hypothetical protein
MYQAKPAQVCQLPELCNGQSSPVVPEPTFTHGYQRAKKCATGCSVSGHAACKASTILTYRRTEVDLWPCARPRQNPSVRTKYVTMFWCLQDTRDNLVAGIKSTSKNIKSITFDRSASGSSDGHACMEVRRSDQTASPCTISYTTSFKARASTAPSITPTVCPRSQTSGADNLSRVETSTWKRPECGNWRRKLVQRLWPSQPADCSTQGRNKWTKMSDRD